MIYRGLKFRPSVKCTGGLDVWDKKSEKWFYTALVNNRKTLDYYLTEQPSKWGRTTEVTLYDLETMNLVGSLKFKY